MANILPFTALRYTQQAGKIEDLIAPGSDISTELRSQLLQKNEHNIVSLTQPQQEEGDRSKFVKYARSAASLSQWRNNDILQLDATPCFYRYRQIFQIPHSAQRVSRTSLFALIKVEPYEKGIILPHEKIFSQHKEDRLRLLEATHAHFGSIFALYQDPSKQLNQLITESEAKHLLNFTDWDGIENRLEAIDSVEIQSQIISGLRDQQVWIADGHHRYETACDFRAKMGRSGVESGADYLMVALSSIDDPGLVLLPTHRIIHSLKLNIEQIKSLLGQEFTLKECPQSQLISELKIHDSSQQTVFGIALYAQRGLIAILKNKDKIVSQLEPNQSNKLNSLDVSILHTYVLEKLLNISGSETISYSRNELEVFQTVEQQDCIAFLMNPPKVQDMLAIASNNERMPPKSTYFYPKLPTGLILWSLNDFAQIWKQNRAFQLNATS